MCALEERHHVGRHAGRPPRGGPTVNIEKLALEAEETHGQAPGQMSLPSHFHGYSALVCSSLVAVICGDILLVQIDPV